MDSDEIMGCIGLLVLAVALIALATVLNAWALKVLWGWFVAPVFELPNLGLFEAMGLSCIVSFLIASTKQDEEDEKEASAWVKAFTLAVIRPLLAVGMGWIIVQFM